MYSSCKFALTSVLFFFLYTFIMYVYILLCLIDSGYAHTRIYCRDTKSEWLFGTMEAIRWKGSYFGRMLEKPHEWNEVVATIGFCVGIQEFLVDQISTPLSNITSVVLIAWMIKLQCAARQQLMMNRWLVRAVLICHLFDGAWEIIWQLFFDQEEYDDYSLVMVIYTVTLDIVAQALCIMAALLLYLRPSGITNGTNSPLGRKWLSVAKTVSAVWLACNLPFDWELVPDVGQFRGPVALIVLCLGSLQTPSNSHSPLGRIIDTILHICCLLEMGLPVFPLYRATAAIILTGVLVIDNLQIPTAIAQVVFSSWKIWMPPNKEPAHQQQQQLGTGIILYGLEPNTTDHSIHYSSILYTLTLFQGMLYIVACVAAQSSTFIRRSLVRQSGLSGEQGVRAVYLYYQQVYTTCTQTGVLSGGDNNLSLASFAIHSLSSNSRELQLAGVFVLDCFLRRGIGSEELVSAITSDSTSVSTLIRMLARTAVQDKDTRLLAARVTAELAATGSLNMASTLDMLKSVSSLLDAADQPALQGCPLTHGPENENDDDSGHNVVPGNDDGIIEEDAGDNQSPGQESSAQSSSGSSGPNNAADLPMHGECSRGVLQELPLTYKQDSIPVLGMTILNRLANDHDRCVEIGMATNLISKIVGFVSCSTTATANTADTEQLEDLVCLCLNLLRRLASTSEKIGAKLRQQLWENPYLLYRLAGILKSTRSKPEKLWEPAIDIIAKLAWDEEARQEIGSAQEIISKLIHAFLGRQEGTNMYYNQPLRMAAGEALANLTISSTTNCLAILDEQGIDIIKDLKDMFFDIKYRYVAANLLQNLCAHCREEMRSSHSSRENLPYLLQKVSPSLPLLMQLSPKFVWIDFLYVQDLILNYIVEFIQCKVLTTIKGAYAIYVRSLF